MNSDFLSTLICQECGAPLSWSNIEGETGTLGCTDCTAEYPVLAGIPLLHPQPRWFLAQYRESVLAALVDFDVATEANVALVRDWTRGQSAEPMRFGDDWTASEIGEGQEVARHFLGPVGLLVLLQSPCLLTT